MGRILKSTVASTLAVALLFPNFFEHMYDLDARGIALGGAVSAMPRDGNTVSINPAGLPFLKFPVITVLANSRNLGLETATGTAWLFDSMGSYVMSFNPFGGAGIAVNYEGLISDSQMIFSAFQTTLSYGIRVIPDLGLGLGLRVQWWGLSQTVPGFEAGYGAATFNINIGALYRISELMAVAFAAQNLLGLDNTSGKSGLKDSIDRTILLGYSFRTGGTEKNAFNVDADVKYTFGTTDTGIDFAGGSLTLLSGIEFFVLEFLPVRAGIELQDLIAITNFVNNTYLAAGFGVKVASLTVDVAYRASPVLNSFGTVSLSLSYTFPTVSLDSLLAAPQGPTTAPQETVPPGVEDVAPPPPQPDQPPPSAPAQPAPVAPQTVE